MKTRILTALLFAFTLTACDIDSSADSRERQATKQLTEQAATQVGMPQIVNFQEKRMAKMLLEMRDQNISTHAYVMNELRGCLVYLGPSVGFGIPYSAQYTNPERVEYLSSGITLPQPEPNGLFMPDSASGTWVMLKNPDGKDVKPVYIEPNVVVSLFRLTAQECG